MNQPQVTANEPAERGYLANCMMDPGYMLDHPLKPEAMFFTGNRKVLETMSAMIEAGEKELGPANVAAWIKAQTGERPDHVVMETLRDVDLNVPFSAFYAGQVREEYRRRETARAAQVLAVAARDHGESLDRVIQEAFGQIEAVTLDESAALKVRGLRDMLGGAVERFNERGARPDPGKVDLTLGHYQLDAATGGFRRKSVCVFGAASHWGKSSWALMVADLNIQAGRRVLIVSGEDAEELWADRWLQYRARMNRKRFDRGDASPEERDRVVSAAVSADPAPVFLDAIGRGVDWIAREIRALIRREGIDLVIVDYLGALVTEKTSGDDQRLRVNYVARTLTTAVKQGNAAGLFFSQITPGSDGSMYSLRDSKDIANAAEVVLIGMRTKEGRVLKLAKNKPGPEPAGEQYALSTDNGLQLFTPTTEAADPWSFARPMEGPL